ncbi:MULTISPECIES: hypothetical protein [unclassified Streptomyces]
MVLRNTGISHGGAQPGILFGEAITKIVAPGRVFSLSARPAAR